MIERIQRFNTRLAELITAGVASMWCAYLFSALAIYGFPFSGMTSQRLVQWIAQTFLQLVLLSVIMVGQSNQSKKMQTLHDSHKVMHRKLDSLMAASSDPE